MGLCSSGKSEETRISTERDERIPNRQGQGQGQPRHRKGPDGTAGGPRDEDEYKGDHGPAPGRKNKKIVPSVGHIGPRGHYEDKFVPASRMKATPGGGAQKKRVVEKLTFHGDKYSYQADKEKWLKIPMRVAIERKPFNEGGMRLVYRCEEIDEKDNSRIPCVAKVFKDGEGAQAYFDEAMTQMVAESYAQEFNRECSKKNLNFNVGFVPVSVLHLKTQDGRRLIYNVEPLLKGHYVKHNDNDGHVETKLQLPQAFSHYTYERSNNLLVVVDIQGVGSFYTDPQIHSFDGEGFGLGNLGREGLEKFLKTHKCNHVCGLLQLPKVTVTETDYEMAKRLQEEEIAGAKADKAKGKGEKPKAGGKWTSVRYKKQLKDLAAQVNS